MGSSELRTDELRAVWRGSTIVSGFDVSALAETGSEMMTKLIGAAPVWEELPEPDWMKVNAEKMTPWVSRERPTLI